jgi:flagellar hook assembly protein FlgD
MIRHPAYPNPFNTSTVLRYYLPQADLVLMQIYDSRGREVSRLADHQMDAGYHQITWQGKAADGRELPSGLYIVRLMTSRRATSVKMVLLK